jgi:hypothetical protein
MKVLPRAARFSSVFERGRRGPLRTGAEQALVVPRGTREKMAAHDFEVEEARRRAC